MNNWSDAMFRLMMEEVAELLSLGVFATMIAVWALVAMPGA